MSKSDILQVLRESFDEDRKRSPLDGFNQMVAEGRIDSDGKPIWKDGGTFISKSSQESDEQN